MANSKDKRIKKMRKKHIWPYILGLFVITLIFGSVLVIWCLLSISDVVQRKLIEGYTDTEPITELFETYDDEDEEDIQNIVLLYLEMMEDSGAVWVSDLEGNEVWASGEQVPNMEYSGTVYIDENVYMDIVLADNSTSIFTFTDNTIQLNENILTNFEIDTDSEGGYDAYQEIIKVKVWYVREINNFKVYVLRDINVYAYDYYMLFMGSALFGITISVFIVYYLITFISIIVNMHKTSKVIYTDMVTGGNNWLFFVKKGTKLLRRKSVVVDYAVIHLKMRKFRSFCTCFGVKEGEVLMENLYQILRKNVKRNELVVYKENASFGLLLSYTNEQELCNRIDTLTKDLDAVLPKMKLYFAVGVYQVHKKETDVEQLYNNAVLACDMLGEEAESRTIFFNVEMNKRRLWERRVEDDMDAALANHEFQVYLQPKISTVKETLAGAEALVRWIHPQEGFIPPNRFIPIFERNGFILKLDDYMLEEIAKQQAEWIEQGRNVVPISVNISRAHFAKEDLAEHICSLVDKYRVPHNLIELELTESAFFDDKEVLLQTVKKLRESGFIVSMDDFGAGYSSLNSLKELQLDVLKLDADFFRGSDAGNRGLLIVSEVIEMAKKLNMKIVAEGIENREQVDFLTEQECDLIQGYFYAKPMPIAEFEEKYSEE